MPTSGEAACQQGSENKAPGPIDPKRGQWPRSTSQNTSGASEDGGEVCGTASPQKGGYFPPSRAGLPPLASKPREEADTQRSMVRSKSENISHVSFQQPKGSTTAGSASTTPERRAKWQRKRQVTLGSRGGSGCWSVEFSDSGDLIIRPDEPETRDGGPSHGEGGGKAGSCFAGAAESGIIPPTWSPEVAGNTPGRGGGLGDSGRAPSHVGLGQKRRGRGMSVGNLESRASAPAGVMSLLGTPPKIGHKEGALSGSGQQGRSGRGGSPPGGSQEGIFPTGSKTGVRPNVLEDSPPKGEEAEGEGVHGSEEIGRGGGSLTSSPQGLRGAEAGDPQMPWGSAGKLVQARREALRRRSAATQSFSDNPGHVSFLNGGGNRVPSEVPRTPEQDSAWQGKRLQRLGGRFGSGRWPRSSSECFPRSVKFEADGVNKEDADEDGPPVGRSVSARTRNEGLEKEWEDRRKEWEQRREVTLGHRTGSGRWILSFDAQGGVVSAEAAERSSGGCGRLPLENPALLSGGASEALEGAGEFYLDPVLLPPELLVKDPLICATAEVVALVSSPAGSPPARRRLGSPLLPESKDLPEGSSKLSLGGGAYNSCQSREVVETLPSLQGSGGSPPEGRPFGGQDPADPLVVSPLPASEHDASEVLSSKNGPDSRVLDSCTGGGSVGAEDLGPGISGPAVSESSSAASGGRGERRASGGSKAAESSGQWARSVSEAVSRSKHAKSCSVNFAFSLGASRSSDDAVCPSPSALRLGALAATALSSGALSGQGVGASLGGGEERGKITRSVSATPGTVSFLLDESEGEGGRAHDWHGEELEERRQVTLGSRQGSIHRNHPLLGEILKVRKAILASFLETSVPPGDEDDMDSEEERAALGEGGPSDGGQIGSGLGVKPAAEPEAEVASRRPSKVKFADEQLDPCRTRNRVGRVRFEECSDKEGWANAAGSEKMELCQGAHGEGSELGEGASTEGSRGETCSELLLEEVALVGSRGGGRDVHLKSSMSKPERPRVAFDESAGQKAGGEQEAMEERRRSALGSREGSLHPSHPMVGEVDLKRVAVEGDGSGQEETEGEDLEEKSRSALRSKDGLLCTSQNTGGEIRTKVSFAEGEMVQEEQDAKALEEQRRCALGCRAGSLHPNHPVLGEINKPKVSFEEEGREEGGPDSRVLEEQRRSALGSRAGSLHPRHPMIGEVVDSAVASADARGAEGGDVLEDPKDQIDF